MMAFRNARNDKETGNPHTSDVVKYLFGVFGSAANSIYWGAMADGSRRVILRKVDNAYAPLEGAKFKLYNQSGSEIAWPDLTDSSGDPIAEAPSLSNGTIYVGVMNYGTYYLKETGAPTKVDGKDYDGNVGKWYCVIVDENDVYMSAGYNDKEKTDEQNRASALENANSLMPTATP